MSLGLLKASHRSNVLLQATQIEGKAGWAKPSVIDVGQSHAVCIEQSIEMYNHIECLQANQPSGMKKSMVPA